MQTTVTEMEWGVREGGKDRIIKRCEGLMEVTDLVTIWIVVMKSLVVTYWNVYFLCLLCMRVWPQGMCNLSSLTRDQTHTLCTGNVES